jgi:hypothetical protein
VRFGLDTPQSRLATTEPVSGVVIEGVFVTMLIQWLFHSMPVRGLIRRHAASTLRV